MKRLTLLGSAAALAAAGLSIHLVTAGGTTARSGRVAVARTHARPTGELVLGDRLAAKTHGDALAAAVSAPLVGSFGAVAVPWRNGNEVAYNTWRWARQIDWHQSLAEQGVRTGDVLGTPTLRVRDARTGRELALEPGTFSASWRADGALAYVRGRDPDYRANTPYLRDVIVRPSPSAAGVVWSTAPDRYVVVGWANRRLIVADQVPGGGTNLVLFSGPAAEHPLAPNAEPIAISPDGSAALVAESSADTGAPALKLVAVSDAHELARIPIPAIVDPETSAPITWIAGPGDWSGDHVVASSSTGLVVLHANAHDMSVEQVLHVDSATTPNGMLYEPRFVEGDTRSIAAWSDVAFGSQAAQLVCDRIALTCKEGMHVPASAAPRPVYDRSGGER